MENVVVVRGRFERVEVSNVDRLSDDGQIGKKTCRSKKMCSDCSGGSVGAVLGVEVQA